MTYRVELAGLDCQHTMSWSLIEETMALFRPSHGIVGAFLLHFVDPSAVPIRSLLRIRAHRRPQTPTAITACFSVFSPPPPSLSSSWSIRFQDATPILLSSLYSL